MGVLNVSVTSSGEVVLLGVQKVQVEGKEGRRPGILFFDSGSTLTLCRHQWAREAGYEGRDVSIFMRVLGRGYEEVHTQEDKVIKVWAIGLEQLTQEAPRGDLSTAYGKFPHVAREDLERPEGPIDILLGQDYAGYLPRMEEARDHLLLLRSSSASVS